jgi:uncharacterized protein
MDMILVDTGYWLLARDQNHPAAVQHWQSLTDHLPRLVATSYIFDEVVTFFNSRGYHDKAVQVGNWLLHSPSIYLVQVDEALFFAGWNYFQKHQDKSYSLTDCISFVVMEQLKINTAFTFDQHFTQAGFEQEPHLR